MKSDDAEARMRELEWFHELRILPTVWPVLRVDGRGFTKLTERHFERPFDPRFHEIMLKTAEALLSELHGIFAFTESDEISILLPADTQLFDREVEKLVSISAGVASSTFALQLGSAAHFDSRVWLGPTRTHVLDYFRWRQSDAARCCLNGWCYWTLRKEGKSVQQATSALEGKTFSEKNELLFSRGINFNDLPLWQKHGVGLYWETFEKVGINPSSGAETIAARRRIRVDKELPRGDAFSELVAQVLQSTAGE